MINLLVFAFFCLPKSSEPREIIWTSASTAPQQITLVAGRFTLRGRLVSAKEEGKSAGYLGGVPGQLKTRVEFLTLSEGDTVVNLPRSSYADWSDLQSIRVLMKDDRPVEIHVVGGDAGESYEVRLVLKGLRVRERVVTSGEDPKVVYERTSYTAS
jgi:hypothetical protein